VKLAKVQSAEGDREFIAHRAAQRAFLGKAKVVGIGGSPPTNKAGLGGNELEVRLVSIPARLADPQLK